MVDLEHINSEGNEEKSTENGFEVEVNERCTLGQGPENMTDSPSNSTTFQMQKLLVELQRLRTCQEKQAFYLNLPLNAPEDCIGVCERDSAVTTIKSMQRFYNFNCDTLSDAVNILDRFISKVKVKRKYLTCVAAASFFLSTKMNEESEHHPSASDLASLHRLAWKPSDLKRMEKIILDKLDWNLFPSATCLSFIKIIYKVLLLLASNINAKFLKKMIDRSELYMNYARISHFKACTLAISIVHQCLKESNLHTVITNHLLLNIQSACYVTDSELFECESAISNQLDQYNNNPALYPRCLPMPKIVPRPNLIKRPSFYGNSDLPTIQEVSWNNELREEMVLYDNQDEIVTRTSSGNKSNSYCQILSQCSILQHGHFLYKTCNFPVF
ncbi:hypothetical protein ACF0H5_010504 [Mactra antiquata]